MVDGEGCEFLEYFILLLRVTDCTFHGYIEQIFCLPVPEKATRQCNYIIIPRGGDGVGAPASTNNNGNSNATTTTVTTPEPLVWTVPETAPKTVTIGASTNTEDETYVSVISRAIKEGWGGRREVVTPRKEEFVSALSESHRKGEPTWHVKAFRGSKEGMFVLSFASINTKEWVADDAKNSIQL